MAPTPAIWPEKATPATSSARPLLDSAVWIVRCAELSISPKSCHTHPGSGYRSSTSSKAAPRMVPSSSTTATFVPSVPRSHPTNRATFSPLVAGVGNDLWSVLTLHDEYRETFALDGLVVVTRVPDVGGEEDQLIVTNVNAPVRPPSGDVIDSSSAHRFDDVTTVLGRHHQPSFSSQADVDLRPIPLHVKVPLGQIELALDLAGFHDGCRAHDL